MPERENTCCFTGHREYKLPWGSDENDPRCRKLQQQIFDAVDAVYAAGIRHFICGMANGCDLYFFDAARYLRLQHPEVTIEAAIPYSGQADRWRPELRERYAYDLPPAGEVVRKLVTEFDAARRRLEIIQIPIDRAPVER